MTYVLVFFVAFFIAWKLGRKYQDFQDLMLARRVSKLVDQREKLSRERDEYDLWERQDKRIRKVMEATDDDRGVSGFTRPGQNVPYDEVGAQAHEERHTGLR